MQGGITFRKGGSSLRTAYDDFTFGIAGDITGFGMVGRINAGVPKAIYWEIRTEVSEGDAGTLVVSGQSAPAARASNSW